MFDSSCKSCIARPLLRAATSELHSRVDAALSGSFDTDLDAYIAFLKSLARGVLPLERLLEQSRVECLLPDWPRRRRAPALLRDLAAFDATPPPSADKPSPDGEAWLFGALYVLEGSRLGGKLLLKRVQANPDPRAAAATAYLGHGAGGSLWPSFLERLEASDAVAEAPHKAVAGARAAFGLFGA
jgi:heme oxygenase